MSQNKFTEHELENILRTPIEAKQPARFSEEELEKLISEPTQEDIRSAQDIPAVIPLAVGAARTPDVLARGALRLLGHLQRIRPATQFLLRHDPIQRAADLLRERPAFTAGEFAGGLTLPIGELRGLSLLGRLGKLGATATGLSGLAAFGQERAPTPTQAATQAILGGVLGTGAGALTETAISPLSRFIRKTKIVSDLGNSFKNFMGGLRGDLTPLEAEAELHKAATQKPQANKFVSDLLGDENFSDKSLENNPKILRDETKNLDKFVNSEAKNRYNKAFEMAEKGGRFGIVFPTASRSAKDILQREMDFSGYGIPRADIDKALSTVKGIAEGGIEREPTTGKIIAAKQQNFQTATETIKRLKEMANRFRKEENLTASGLLGGLAKDVEADSENALRERSPEALERWKDANNYWRRNVLPLRTKTIQNAITGAGKIGNLGGDLLDTENIDLPNVLNQLSPEGKKALAFDTFKDSVMQKRGALGKEVNPRKLVSIFSNYDNENLPFMRSTIGEGGIQNLRDIAANRLVGIDENVDRLSRGLSNPENVDTFKNLPQNDKNIILFNHFKHALTDEADINPDKFEKLSKSIHQLNRNALLENNPITKESLNALEELSRMERKVTKLTPKAKRIEENKKRLLSNLLRAVSAAGLGMGGLETMGIGGAITGGALGGVAPDIFNLLRYGIGEERLAPGALKTLRGLTKLQQRLTPFAVTQATEQRGKQ